MKFGASCSTLDDSYQASKTAAEKAVAVSSKPDLAIVFNTNNYQQDAVLEAIKGVVGDKKIIGCCTGSVIFDEDKYEKAVVVATIRTNGTRVATALHGGIGKDSYGAGQKAGQELLASGIDGGLVIALPDGTTGNKTEVVQGLYNEMGPDYTYIGGGSGLSPQSPGTCQFTEVGVKDDALAVALLEGVTVRTGMSHGWKPGGDFLIITGSEGKRVYEIDGRPAFDVYAELLGVATAEDLLKRGKQRPLGIPDASGNYIIRDPKFVHDDKSIDFVSEVPENTLTQIMEGSIEEQIDADRQLVDSIFSDCTTPEFVLVFDCNSRIKLLGEQFKTELTIIRQSVGREVPVVGTLAFGEIGSFVGIPKFHNKTVCLAALSSREKE